MDGVLVVDKPKGLTSHDVVSRVRRALGTKRVGHVGTLDPMATGVLPLVIGRATRLASLLSVGPKTYAAVIRLGIVTDTYDVTGSVMPSAPGEITGTDIALDAIETASRRFVGTFHQQPPPFSAKKIRGVRAYRLARRRRPVSLSPVEITVYEFQIQSLELDRLYCRVSCSPGFYMRALAHDLGQTLGCGACLESLRREQSGPFTPDQAVNLTQLGARFELTEHSFISIGNLLPELPTVVVTESGLQRVVHGNVITHADVKTPPLPSSLSNNNTGGVNKVKVYDQSGTLLAIAEAGPGDTLHPRIVLV